MLCKDNQEYSIGLNMCDLLFRYKGYEDMLGDYFKGIHCERIYIGSYFCSHYFMKAAAMFSNNLLYPARENNWKVTLVIPIIKEELLENFHKRTLSLLTSASDVIDEVVVNDSAMLEKMENIRSRHNLSYSITAGRLMVKNLRDARYREFTAGSSRIFFPAECKNRVEAIEIDIVSSNLDYADIPSNVAIHVHYPFTYVSCGTICEYAAANNVENLYLQTSKRCGSVCMKGYLTTRDAEVTLLHVGKAVYFQNPELVNQSRESGRYIYWPLGELMGTQREEGDVYENTGTF